MPKRVRDIAEREIVVQVITYVGHTLTLPYATISGESQLIRVIRDESVTNKSDNM